MIPIVLFTYARPEHLRRTLASLKANQVPKIYVYCDGAKTKDKEPAVQEVRKIIGEINWCETIVTERDTNLGLGKSILTGVSEVFEKEEMAIVVEDDLICVPGTYQYLTAALKQYKDNKRVMSVTGWTHRLVTPPDIYTRPYFDGRAECWVWGTWKRAWDGILDYDAQWLMHKLGEPDKYGYDLPEMAAIEHTKNIWAVRFLYWHLYNGGLCMRPPWSMVDHIGDDLEGTNVKGDLWTKCTGLYPSPHLPKVWPEPIENRWCAKLHKKASEQNRGIMSRVKKLCRF